MTSRIPRNGSIPEMAPVSAVAYQCSAKLSNTCDPAKRIVSKRSGAITNPSGATFRAPWESRLIIGVLKVSTPFSLTRRLDVSISSTAARSGTQSPVARSTVVRSCSLGSMRSIHTACVASARLTRSAVNSVKGDRPDMATQHRGNLPKTRWAIVTRPTALL